MGWLNGWSKRQKLTLDHTLVDADLSNFPVKVIVPDTNPLFDTAKPDGADVRFTSSDGETLLDFEREVHDDTNSIAVYHVKIPLVSSTLDTDFYLYYGNASAMDASSPSSVWDSDYKLVMHMGPTLEDSTSNSNDGTNSGTTLGLASDGYYRSFDGGNDYIFIPDNVSLDLTTIMTGEVYVKPDVMRVAFPYSKHVEASSGYECHLRSDNAVRFLVHHGSGSPGYTALDTTGTIDITGWHYLATTFDNGNMEAFLNGTKDATTATAPVTSIPTNSTALNIGRRDNSTYYLDGAISEVRISSTTRSDAWIKATHNSLADNLVAFGGEESWISVTVTENVMFTESGFALTTEVINGYMYIRIRFAGGPEMEFSVKQPETEASMK